METSFIDTVHNVKVELNSTQKRVFQLIPEEIDRLKGIHNLGIITRIFPTAYHTKFDHQVGVIYMLQRAELLKQMPESFLKAFHVAAATYHIGHLPFTYASERALLLASVESEHVKSSLIDYISPLDNIPRKNNVCNKKCKIDETAPTALLNGAIDRQEWKSLYKLFTAVKIFSNEKLRTMLRDVEAETLHILLGQECQCHQLLNRLDRLDYILRDLAYAATFKVQCNPEQLIANSDANEWKLISACESNYLDENLYNTPRVRLLRAIFEKGLASLFQRSPDLFRKLLTPTDKLSTDDGLRAYTSNKKAFKGVFDDGEPSFQKYWSVSFPSIKETPAQTERELTGHKMGLLFYPQRTRTLLMPESDRHPLLISVSSFSNPEPQDFIYFTRLIERLCRHYPAHMPSEDALNSLFEYLIGSTARVFTGSIFQIIGDYILDAHLWEPIWEIIASHYRRMPKLPDIGKFDVQIKSQDLQISISDNPLASKHMLNRLSWDHADEMDRKKLSRRLASTLIGNAHWLCSPPTNALRARLRELATLLHDKILSDSDTRHAKGALLESYALLDIISRRTEKSGYKWITANLKCPELEGTPGGREYDVIEISISSSSGVSIQAWGCTTDRDLIAKQNADGAKLNSLERRIHDRFPDIRVSKDGYFFIQDGEIFELFGGIRRQCS